MRDADRIRKYWDERAKEAAGAPSGTTGDVYLRELETDCICSELSAIVDGRSIRVLDVGCGDGKTTAALAEHFPDVEFVGVDFSSEMIASARAMSSCRANAGSIQFVVGDARDLGSIVGGQLFDVILTNRCLINILDQQEQYDTVTKIASLLRERGWYLGTENFQGGQKNLNQLRRDMQLPEIPIRWHNRYFDEGEFLARTSKIFASVELVNFSSTYYLVTRVVYSALCHQQGRAPDYSDPIHPIAIKLPSVGDFSPIKLVRANKGG